jgi:hypothetical protein
MRGTDEHIGIRKQSSMFHSLNRQTPKMNKGERRKKNSTLFNQENNQKKNMSEQINI